MKNGGSTHTCPHTRTAHWHRGANTGAARHLAALIHTDAHAHRAYASAHARAHTAAAHTHTDRKRPDRNTDPHTCRSSATRQREAGSQKQKKSMHGSHCALCLARN